MSESTPLLPRPANDSPPRGDSHPATLRACHSPWHLVGQKVLLGIRSVLAAYLTAVFGVSLKYKMEVEDDHSLWRIPFQFSTVSFCLLWVYHLLVTLWTGVHLFLPQEDLHPEADDEGRGLKQRVVSLLSPPLHSGQPTRRFAFSLFYTVAHVFAFMNTILYWAVLVPAGHGGFPRPRFPHHHHGSPGNSTTTVLYKPTKGLFEEDGIKSFSIINVWTITSLVAALEIMFLNSIRRQNPVAKHALGVTGLSALYLVWAGVGKLATGHAGLFFLDPELVGGSLGAVFAAAIAFVASSPGFFAFMYGLIAMRETVTAHHRS